MSASIVDDNGVCVRVPDFTAGGSWQGDGTERARWCCQQLEEGKVLCLEGLPFELPDEDRRFLLALKPGDSRLHKNISYRPGPDVLRGFSGEAEVRMHEVMRRYSAEVLAFLKELLAPYAPHWVLDYASFRPQAEQSRNLPTRKRNDLLHVDAFPNRPTRGGRILRCFTNINATEPRVWQTTDGFGLLAERYAAQAGLARIAGSQDSAVRAWARSAGQRLGLQPKGQSGYDRFMLRFHDCLKENQEFQRSCRKIELRFAPGNTWICFTDAVPHAVTYGQYALEQTVIVPLRAMLAPDKSPLRVLENLVGKPLVDGGSEFANPPAVTRAQPRTSIEASS